MCFCVDSSRRSSRCVMLDRMHRLVCASVAALLVAGCAVGPNYREPKTSVNERFESAPLLASGSEGEIDREWWKRFGDPVLDELVASATANNRDLAAATARLREARAQRRERLFDFLPTITGKGSYDNVRQSAAGTPGVPAGTPV